MYSELVNVSIFAYMTSFHWGLYARKEHFHTLVCVQTSPIKWAEQIVAIPFWCRKMPVL